jgi:hypothetical protein
MIMPHARAEAVRAARLFAALALFATVPAAAELRLPQQVIDFAADPLLRFLGLPPW